MPTHYFYIPKERRPQEITKLIRLYYRTWVFHPIKRRIAKRYLWILQNIFGLKVIVITGSAGKTSTKEMLHSILELATPTVSSFANIDSTFNIPTTVLKCKFSTRYLILEMGAEYPGDMEFYRWLVTPDIAVVTNVYQTHTYYFRNIAGVAREKSDIVKDLAQTSFAVLNKENKHTRKMASKTHAQVVWFGQGSKIVAKNIKISFAGTAFTLAIDENNTYVNIRLIGEHFVNNALAAAAVAHTLGLSLDIIKKGLGNSEAPDHRLNPIKLKNGAILLDDVYNNNPSAAEATFKTVKELRGKRKLILVYGDMKELGDTEIQRHGEIGKAIEDLGASHVILVGPLSHYTQQALKKTGNTLVETTKEVLPVLRPLLDKNSLVLFKGARSLLLEQAIEKLH